MKIIKVILSTICISLLAIVLINTASHYSALGEALNSKRQSNWITSVEIPLNLKVFFEASEGDNYWKSNYMINLLFKAKNQFEHKRRSVWLSIVFNVYNEDALQEAFFNLAYLGKCNQNLIQGIVTASKCMLNKKVNDLTMAEIAYFAVVVRSPSRLLKNYEMTKSKRNELLKKVHSSGKISSKEFEQALSEKMPKA